MIITPRFHECASNDELLAGIEAGSRSSRSRDRETGSLPSLLVALGIARSICHDARMMKAFVLTLLFTAGFLCNAFAAELAVLGQDDFRYRAVDGWAREALSKVKIKNGHGLAIDGAGRILFLTDDPQNNVIILNAAGELLVTWTARMPGEQKNKFQKDLQDCLLLKMQMRRHLLCPETMVWMIFRLLFRQKLLMCFSK